MFNILILILFYGPSIWLTSAEQYSNVQKNGQELLLCRKCGADVADSHYLFSKHSPGAKKANIQNLFGRQNITVQTLVNPFGVKFDIITAEKARCVNVGPSQGADSWFPGYTWKICTCPHCGHHLGWTFETANTNPIENEKDNITLFHGLILNNILGENLRKTENQEQEDEEDENDEFDPPPSIKEALKAAKLLENYFLYHKMPQHHNI